MPYTQLLDYRYLSGGIVRVQLSDIALAYRGYLSFFIFHASSNLLPATAVREQIEPLVRVR